MTEETVNTYACSKFQLLCNMIYAILELQIRALVYNYIKESKILSFCCTVSRLFMYCTITLHSCVYKQQTVKCISLFFFTGARASDDLLKSPD